MAVNKELAVQQGLTDEAIDQIELLHDHLDMILDGLTLDHEEEDVRAHVREVEFQLQDLWGFPQDARYHTWVRRVSNRFRELRFLGAVYRCKDSSETRTIGLHELHCGALVSVGRGFIDFGGVVRIVGNLERMQ